MDTNTPVVYIVDDDDAVRTSLAWLLSSVNIRTECFDGPEAFLKAYDANSQSCLILDVRMPEISGFQLQERLKEIGADIPVIFVSGHGDIPMSVRALRNGAVDFLEKPYNSQQMLERIQVTLKSVAGNRQARDRRQHLQGKLKTLTTREREILEKVILGASSKIIARDLNISVKTVDVHRASIKDKLGCQSTASLVRDVLLDLGQDFLKAA
ncbi:response regulator [Herbaspirillum sp. CF444]|uniref:response regulator transcription factor n=1 Tax=Herbaspirillum sp. CF444 TaxID=1144319 RepID=UPI00027239C9|nr:response regulator [Herbaspirillum sp. CF444]EJL92148.1 response regulator [Herbaspirillum sp. CF444]